MANYVLSMNLMTTCYLLLSMYFHYTTSVLSWKHMSTILYQQFINVHQLPAVETVVNNTSAKPTQEHCSISHTADKKFSCTYCWRKFDYRSGLVTHIQTHTGEKPFSCHYCDYSSAQQQNLDRHLRKHTGEKPLSCNVCNRNFANASTLTRHHLTHTGEKSHKCELCGKMFLQKGILKQHLSTHTGEKPYSCDVCGVSFVFRSSSTPARSHRSEIWAVRTCVCDLCGKMFASPPGPRNKHYKQCLLLMH